MNKTAVFTIISNNYLAHARTLMQSLELFNSNWDRYVVLVDNLNNFDTNNNNFSVISLNSLNIPDIDNFLLRYDILECNTAVKPWSFSRLFIKGYHNVVYLDPDIEVFKPLTSIEQSLDGNLMVLTPHLLDPVRKHDDFSDLKIINAGSYNLGFLALSKHTDLNKFLDWWKSKLEFYCLNKQSEGYFVDQKWMELAPSLFDNVIILRDKSLNVAYWNLPERCGESISFFHFSGIEINDSKYLSKHRKQLLISSCGDNTVMLVESYRKKVLKNNYEVSKNIPYEVTSRNLIKGVYLNDIRIDDKYAWASESISVNIIPNSSSIALHLLYISQYYESAPKLSVYINNSLITEVIPHRKNFVIHVPVIADKITALRIESDRSFLPAKILNNGDNRKLTIGIWKVTSDKETLISLETTKRNESGFNLIGNVKSETGVGQVLRCVASSFDDSNVKYSIINWENKLSKNVDTSYSHKISDRKTYDKNIFFINGGHRLSNIFDKSLFQNSRNIGYWCWETENVPDYWYENEDVLDEIWTLSEFCKSAISKNAKIPVKVVSPKVKFSVYNTFDTYKYKIDNKKFKFLFIYDSLSYRQRKNPDAVIQAFRLAKNDNKFKNCILIIKTNSDELDMYKCDDVIIINETMSRQDIYELHNVCNCFISLHRAEGLGFNILESAYLGKEIITTGWSGNVEFLTGSNIHLVDYKLIKIGNDCGPYTKDDIWAEPDVKHAAETMVKVLMKGGDY